MITPVNMITEKHPERDLTAMRIRYIMKCDLVTMQSKLRKSSRESVENGEKNLDEFSSYLHVLRPIERG